MRFPSSTRECGCFLAQRRNYSDANLVRVYRVEMWEFNPRTAQLTNNKNIRALHLVDERAMRDARQQWLDVCSDPIKHACPGKQANDQERKKLNELFYTERASEQQRPVAQLPLVPILPEQQPATPHVPTKKREPFFNHRSGNWEDENGNRVPEPAPKTTEPLAGGADWKERQRIAKEKFEREKR